MAPSAMTTAGIPLSVFDRVALAVKDIFLDNGKLKAWVNGNVIRGEVLALPEGFSGNRIFVGNLPPTFDSGLGVCAPAKISIVVALVWEEFKIALEDADPSVYSVLAECMRALMAKPTLAVPRFGGRNLVQRLAAVRLARQPDYVERPSSVLIAAAFVFEFDLKLNAQTMESAS